MLDYVACKEKRNKFLYYFKYFSITLYDFVDCPVFGSSLIYNTSAKHKQHECNTSNTNAA